MDRLKLAELTSGVGALVLGVGIGALFPRWFGSDAIAITIAGLVLHGVGMWDKHRLESRGAPSPPGWVTILYWICWGMLGILLMWIVVAR